MVKTFHYVNLNNDYFSVAGKKIVIYGRAQTALRTYMELKGMSADVIGFTDSFANGNEMFAGLRVYSLNELRKIENLVIYIAITNEKYKRDVLYNIEKLDFINAEVVSRGVVYGSWEYDTIKLSKMIHDNNDKIMFIKSKLADEESGRIFNNLIEYRITNHRGLLESIYETSHKQYFPTDGIIKPVEGEIFIDAGGFDGLTTVDMAEWTKGKYAISYVFEADDFMYEICSEMLRLNNMQKVKVIKKAVYSHECKIKFDDSYNLSGSANVSGNGNKEVDATSIDLEMKSEDVSYIKMDIEGAEREALLGCKKTIERCRPKLAISIYHKDDDLWEIPYLLMKKYPFYRYYIRHYTPYTTETILYATV